MRDIEQMLDLLEKMANDPGGIILLPKHLGMSEKERIRNHNVELLTDVGLVLQVNNSAFRITNDGYDFLNAVKQDRPKYIAKAKELLDQGKSLLSVAGNIISIVNAVDG